MSIKHKLDEMSDKVMINNNSTLDRVTNSRILKVNFDENLNWEYHVTKVIKTYYSTLASLRKMKRITDFKLRKQLSDVVKLNWLPVKEKIQFNTAKLVHKTLYKEGFPDYLKLELTSNIKNIVIKHGNLHKSIWT